MKSISDNVWWFVRDTRGNIAMLFGLMLFVFLGAAGIAIDFQRSNLVRTEIHEATDAALIAAARYKSGHPNADESELTAIARKVFDDGIKDKSIVIIDAFAISFDSNTETFALDVGGKVNALIMGVLGQNYIDIGTRSEAKLGKPPMIELAMALDTTGSMGSNGKMSTLKNAAKDLVETLLKESNANVKIGVVPFAQYVNVGITNKSASWITGTSGPWLGCVGSRNYPHNVEDTDYLVYKAPGVSVGNENVECPKALQPLTTDETKLDTMINGLAPHGLTYIPAGLTWAWSLLTPSEPFTEAASKAEISAAKGMKALLVMTDGDNTRAPTYPLHESTNKTLADQLTEEICANIKADDIIVYSIAFSVTQQNIKDVLEGCASDASHYFDAANSAELEAAFASIGNSLRSISLSK